MAVYSIEMSEVGKAKSRVLEFTKRFKVFDMVTVTCRDGRTKEGEIVFIEKDRIHLTGPYLPIEQIELREITDIASWDPPEEWK